MTRPITGGVGYVPVSAELREALRRRIAGSGMHRASHELSANGEMLLRIVDVGTARRSVAERLAVLLGVEP